MKKPDYCPNEVWDCHPAGIRCLWCTRTDIPDECRTLMKEKHNIEDPTYKICKHNLGIYALLKKNLSKIANCAITLKKNMYRKLQLSIHIIRNMYRNIRNLYFIETHRFISHFKVESWGYSVLIMEKRGRAFGRLYWYNDDSTTVYLEGLSVNQEIRRLGIGRELQEIRENIGIGFGATTSCLLVKKDSWMHDWYNRRGYENFQTNENEENSIWMKKSLTNNLN